jgi:YHS domain-containing protein
MKIRLKQDPVCGIDVDPSHAGDETQYGGQTFYFCCRNCKETFEGNRARYLAQRPTASLSHLSEPTTPQAFKPRTSQTRHRGLSRMHADIPSGRRTRR